MTSPHIQYGDGCDIENRFFFPAIPIRHIVRLMRNLEPGSRLESRARQRDDQNSKPQKFKMTDGRQFENVFSSYHPISTKFGTRMPILISRIGEWSNDEKSKFSKSKMADGRHTESKKLSYR